MPSGLTAMPVAEAVSATFAVTVLVAVSMTTTLLPTAAYACEPSGLMLISAAPAPTGIEATSAFAVVSYTVTELPLVMYRFWCVTAACAGAAAVARPPAASASAPARASRR
ncbi:hypothetical protein LUR56_38415 [Streptomyces sp. MT29]|nr:hypothetical protein [Streptomyces sp. MT29]